MRSARHVAPDAGSPRAGRRSPSCTADRHRAKGAHLIVIRQGDALATIGDAARQVPRHPESAALPALGTCHRPRPLDPTRRVPLRRGDQRTRGRPTTRPWNPASRRHHSGGSHRPRSRRAACQSRPGRRSELPLPRPTTPSSWSRPAYLEHNSRATSFPIRTACRPSWLPARSWEPWFGASTSASVPHTSAVPRARGFTVDEVITLASIIEKETGRPRGAGRVSPAYSATGSASACACRAIPRSSTASKHFDGDLTRAHLRDADPVQHLRDPRTPARPDRQPRPRRHRSRPRPSRRALPLLRVEERREPRLLDHPRRAQSRSRPAINGAVDTSPSLRLYGASWRRRC